MPRPRTISEDELLAAARAVFVERGFAASTKEVARRAGVSEALLFQRYPTKADLFFAAMVPPAFAVSAQLKKVHSPREMPQALETLGFSLLDYFRAALPVLGPLESHPDFEFEEFARRHPQSSLASMRYEMVEFFRVHRAPDPSAAALILMGTMRSVAQFERLGAHGGRFPSEIITRTIRCLWEGVRPHRRSPSPKNPA